MKHRCIRSWMILLWVLLVAALCARTATAEDFLEPDQAFQLTAELRDSTTLALAWTVAPGYALYRERLHFSAEGAGVKIGEPKLPDGKRKFDTSLNQEVETYHDRLVATLPVTQAGGPFVFKVEYQGCADAGLCYAPMERRYTADPAHPGQLKPLPEGAAALQPEAVKAADASPGATGVAPEDDNSLAQRTLQSGSVWRIGIAFFVFGLLLSFTPCVLPMVPILSSIIVGEGAVSRQRGFLLAAAYCLGMALIYTALGVGAGLAGEGLAAVLQKPWVLALFAALLVTLALSMFDVYQLQLPSSLQSRLTQTSGKLRGGRFIGVFVMGALSALIVGPCVAGPLAGALLYISQTRNVWIGGWALFAMAMGMSVPLLLTGVSAGSLLPRAGAWMNGVKRIFGLLLIAVAVWMVSPVLPAWAVMAAWGCFAILCAVFLHVFDAIPAQARAGRYFSKTLGLALLLCGIFELIGAASSGHDVLHPLAHLRGGDARPAPAQSEARFTRVRTVAEFERTLQAAKTPVLLDFYADWCVSCKEMERFTFSDAKVAERLRTFNLLQVDVTANSEDDRALMKKFGLFGPPGIILFDAAAKEVPQARIIGYLAPDPFLQRLRQYFPS